MTLSEEKRRTRDEHFFEVRLNDIARLRNDTLLNEKQIAHYLAQVPRYAFDAGFSFARKIESRLAAVGERRQLI